MSLLADEHVPRVFVNTLRSNGHEVIVAREVFGSATDDERLPEYCVDNDHILVTHDRKDFVRLSDAVDQAGIVVYTDPNYVRDDPEGAVHTLERVFPTIHLRNWRTNSSGWTSGDDRRNP